MLIFRTFSRIVCAAALASTEMAALAGNENDSLECAGLAAALVSPESPDYLKYARDLEIQPLHLAIDVTPDFQRRTIQGETTMRFKPVVKPAAELKLDAIGLDVRSLTSSEQVQAYHVTDKNIVVTFAHPIPAGTEATVTVRYSAEPNQGIYFRTPEMGYKTNDTHLFTQGEETESRYWFPCLDAPNGKFTSEVTCHVPAGMSVISNGRMVSETSDPASGLKAVHWSQEKPHATYLITLVAGYLDRVQDTYRDIPMSFYTPHSEIEYATNSSNETRALMEFFEQEIGVPYPWAKYDQVCVNDFVAGGMENTSATTLTDSMLHTGASENIHSSEGLIAHELAHQWFGDLVTCKDWSHAWLNEGFATFYELLASGHNHGRDELLSNLYQRSRGITSSGDDPTPIVRRNYDAPRELFGNLIYTKASLVLNMLRAELGADLYRKCIKTYLERHQFGNVVTEDLREVIEELSGRSFDQFFDQWIYHGHFPELDVRWSWDEAAKTAKISVTQTQKLSDNVLLFNFPLGVRFKGKFGSVERSMRITSRQEDFSFPLESAPDIVRINPNFDTLVKISFQMPDAMLFRLLEDKEDVGGRLVAIEQLRSRRSHEAISRLKQALQTDGFYVVRQNASSALRSMHTDEALAALVASMNQPDARVRLRVLEDIGGFYSDDAFAASRKGLEGEKNPAIQAASLRALGGYSKPEVRETLLKFLVSDSYRNELAVAAISAMRSQDDPAYIAPLQDALTKREALFTGFGFAQGLGTLGYLARNQEDRTAVREFLASYVNRKRRTIQIAAIDALGTLGDPKAIPVLQGFAMSGKERPEQPSAEKAVADLRAGRKPVDDFKNLRQEVLDLQRTNSDLRKELDELKKRMEAAQATPPPAQGTATKSKKTDKKTEKPPKS